MIPVYRNRNVILIKAQYASKKGWYLCDGKMPYVTGLTFILNWNARQSNEAQTKYNLNQMNV